MRAFFIVSCLALALGCGLFACNKGGAQPQTATAPTTAAGSAAGQDSAPAKLDGAAIYVKANCAMCHGVDRSGKPMGPALLTLKKNWTTDKLVEYLTDPQGFADNDSRLSAQKQQYTMKMPAPSISQEERYALAQWLLGQ